MAKNSGTTEAGRRIGGVTVTARMVVGLVVTVLAIVFIFMNTVSVRVHLWGISVVSSPLWLVLLVMLVVGGLLGWFTVLLRGQGRRR